VSTIDISKVFYWLKNVGFYFDKTILMIIIRNPKNTKQLLRGTLVIDKTCFIWSRFSLLDDARYFKSETDFKGNHLMLASWACKYQNRNGILL